MGKDKQAEERKRWRERDEKARESSSRWQREIEMAKALGRAYMTTEAELSANEKRESHSMTSELFTSGSSSNSFTGLLYNYRRRLDFTRQHLISRSTLWCSSSSPML